MTTAITAERLGVRFQFDRQSRVVFITRNISEQQVRGLLDALRNLV